MSTPFTVEATLAGVVRPAVLWWRGATVVERPAGFEAVIDAVSSTVVEAVPPDVQPVREMYRRIGLDPTKTRPSNEALLRRVRRGDSFPRVNALVDAVNLCSLECQLPYGVYDRASVEGAVVLRLGRDGEEYAGIRKDTVHVAGRVTVADGRGPFGNPTSDSARTMVTLSTRDALIVIYAPRDTTPPVLQRALDLTASRVAAAVGGEEEGRWTA